MGERTAVRRRWAPVVLPLALGLLVACGSTAQETATLGTSAGGPAPDGLSLDGGGASGGDAAPGAQAAEVPGSSAGASAATSGGPAAGPAAVPGGSGAAPGTPGTADAGAPAPTGEVPVGFFVAKDLGPATRALGVDGLSTGDGARQARTAADLVNRTGGIGGRTVKPVVYAFDASGDAQRQAAEACSLFFEDNRVAAVVGVWLLDQVTACTTRAGVPYVQAGSSTVDRTALERTPLLSLPTTLSVDRVAATLVPQLHRSGFFAPRGTGQAVRVGLLYTDDRTYARVPDLVRAQLRAVGLDLTDSAAIPYVVASSGAAAAGNAGQSAVLRFRSKDITHVVVVDRGGQAASYFSLAGEPQGYRPRLGVSSLSNPALLPLVLSPGQLDGAQGVGWRPVADVPLSAEPATATGKQCQDAMRAAGEDVNGAAARQVQYAVCDGARLLAAAWGQRTADGRAFIAGRQALGTSFATALTFATDQRRSDGAAAVRPLAYDAGCRCFAYTGAPAPAAG